MSDEGGGDGDGNGDGNFGGGGNDDGNFGGAGNMMGMGGGGEITETTHQSGASRMCNSMLGALCSPCVLLVALILLGWNEKRAVCDTKAISAGESAVTEADCVDTTKGNNDLIIFSCPLQEAVSALPVTGDFASSFDFKGVCMRAEAEMYQCVETSTSTTTKDKVGGGSTTVTTYSYSKAWKASAVDSSKFKAGFQSTTSWNTYCNTPIRSSTSNPAWPSSLPKVGSVYAPSAKAGPWTLPQDPFLTSVDCSTALTPSAVPAGYRQNGVYYQSISPADGTLGTYRAKFIGNDLTKPDVTVVGKNSNGQMSAWTAPSSWLCQGSTVSGLQSGKITKDKFFADMKASNTAVTWILRLIGFLLAWLAFCLVAGPLEIFADCIPCIGPYLGDAVQAVITCVACLPAFACSIFVCGIVWVAMRPLVGGPLMLLCLCILGGLIYFKFDANKKQKHKSEEEGAQSGMQQPPMQQPMNGQQMGQPMQQPMYGQPMGQPMQQPMYGQPMGQPMQQPMYGQPMGQPMQQPMYGQQMMVGPNGQPMYSQQPMQPGMQPMMYGQPGMQGQLMYGQPMQGQPMYGQPPPQNQGPMGFNGGYKAPEKE